MNNNFISNLMIQKLLISLLKINFDCDDINNT